MRTLVIPLLVALSLTSIASAADPPDRINYQGVLRNSSDEPLDGNFPMTFRLFDALTGGNEILVDTHGAVTVSNGLFNVEIGGGSVTDGSGPGTFTLLTDAFAEHTDLYLEVEVSGETLSPRTPVSAAGFALNTRRVRGREIISDGPLDLYVDDNTCPGVGSGTLADPYCRIQSAIDAIPSLITGDVTVHIADGAYSEEVRIIRRPEPRRPSGFAVISLEGNPSSPAAVVLDGSGTLEDGISIGGVVFVIISGMKITGFADEAVNIGPSSTTLLQECEVTGNTGVGIDVFSADAFLSNCTISNNGNWGIDLGRSYMEIEGTTTVTGNAGNGIKVWANSFLALNQNSTVTFDLHSGGGEVALLVESNSHVRSPAAASFNSNATAVVVTDNSSVVFEVTPTCTGNGQDFVASFNGTIRGHGGSCACTPSPGTEALCAP